MYIYIYMYTYLHWFNCMHVSVYVYVYASVYVCIYTCIRDSERELYMYICTCSYVCLYFHEYEYRIGHFWPLVAPEPALLLLNAFLMKITSSGLSLAGGRLCCLC